MENNAFSNDIEDNKPDSLKFDYVRSNQFRMINADGFTLAFNPSGKINIYPWAERAPIPRQVIHELADDGSLGKEVDRVSRDALIRDVDFGVTLDIVKAKHLIESLQRLVNWMEDIEEEES